MGEPGRELGGHRDSSERMERSEGHGSGNGAWIRNRSRCIGITADTTRIATDMRTVSMSWRSIRCRRTRTCRWAGFWTVRRVEREGRESDVAFWSRYVTHYLIGKSLRGKRALFQFLSKEQITNLLPDFDALAPVDGIFKPRSLRNRSVRREVASRHRENREFRGNRVSLVPPKPQKACQCVFAERFKLSSASLRSVSLSNLSALASSRRYVLSANRIADLRGLFDAAAQLQCSHSVVCDRDDF